MIARAAKQPLFYVVQYSCRSFAFRILSQNKSHQKNNVFTGFADVVVTFQIFSIITIALNVAYVSDAVFSVVTFQGVMVTVW